MQAHSPDLKNAFHPWELDLKNTFHPWELVCSKRGRLLEALGGDQSDGGGR